jgi:hypothetical protein
MDLCCFLYLLYKFYLHKHSSDLTAFLTSGFQERAQSALRAHSSSRKNSKKEINVPEDCAALTGQLQPFVKEEVLVPVFNVMMTNILLASRFSLMVWLCNW